MSTTKPAETIPSLTTDADYQSLRGRISQVYTAGQLRAHQVVNAQADYGTALLASLSRGNSLRSRQFCLAYSKGAKPSHLLRWSHHVELLKVAALESKVSRHLERMGFKP